MAESLQGSRCAVGRGEERRAGDFIFMQVAARQGGRNGVLTMMDAGKEGALDKIAWAESETRTKVPARGTEGIEYTRGTREIREVQGNREPGSWAASAGEGSGGAGVRCVCRPAKVPPGPLPGQAQPCGLAFGWGCGEGETRSSGRALDTARGARRSTETGRKAGAGAGGRARRRRWWSYVCLEKS